MPPAPLVQNTYGAGNATAAACTTSSSAGWLVVAFATSSRMTSPRRPAGVAPNAAGNGRFRGLSTRCACAQHHCALSLRRGPLVHAFPSPPPKPPHLPHTAPARLPALPGPSFATPTHVLSQEARRQPCGPPTLPHNPCALLSFLAPIPSVSPRSHGPSGVRQSRKGCRGFESLCTI